VSQPIRELIGKRCLLKVDERGSYSFGQTGVTEFVVREVSPSGNWIKLQNIFGNQFWKPVSQVALVETLTDLKAS
jgi:hypothetical protein